MPFLHRLIAVLFTLLVVAVGGTAARAQSEPTVDQIYQAANSGRLAQARTMVDQVVRNHPDSAKAHYVRAEIAARQRDAGLAQQELAAAERLAPGLPFARSDAVQALRTQVDRLAQGPADTRAMGGPGAPGDVRSAASAGPGLPWGTLAIGAALVVGALALLRRRQAARTAPLGMPPAGSFGTPGAGPHGPQGPGTPGATPYAGPGMQPGPAGAWTGAAPGGGWGPGAQGPSMGSALGRGLATGLAVGAGAVAAHEIGRRMFDQHPGPPAQPAGNDTAGWYPGPDGMVNADMGGQDFGIQEPGSWDAAPDNSAGLDAGDVGGGGDWDT
ncbi:MAG TPA: hypothetical protein VFE82_17325 [Ramlibacter sp.]|jgi:hypothetical protein|uniref:hypothetical protein n=1 Tax=Ramlibacter sp. TaxID=1917967 RepID=UPI002D36F0F6|nr:hypothetical protein [Ramlibacter sp.]HZY20235.1 hypothetical protein [Ramlibacter sp.]